MAREALVNKRLWKELPSELHPSAKDAMKKLKANQTPGQAVQVRPLEGSSFQGSYRLRLGRYRICFMHFPAEDVIVFTTAFMKKRPSDYLKAVRRHDRRIREQE